MFQEKEEQKLLTYLVPTRQGTPILAIQQSEHYFSRKLTQKVLSFFSIQIELKSIVDDYLHRLNYYIFACGKCNWQWILMLFDQIQTFRKGSTYSLKKFNYKIVDTLSTIQYTSSRSSSFSYQKLGMKGNQARPGQLLTGIELIYPFPSKTGCLNFQM